MDHVAIMRKSWGLLPKILTGEKRIESRWYKHKRAPWGNIQKGDTVYFKDSGEPVTLKATVDKLLCFEDLTPEKVKHILDKYRKPDGIPAAELSRFYKMFEDKKYCLLIYLRSPQKVKPFDIDKRGFGIMAAWLIVDDIKSITKSCSA